MAHGNVTGWIITADGSPRSTDTPVQAVIIINTGNTLPDTDLLQMLSESQAAIFCEQQWHAGLQPMHAVPGPCGGSGGRLRAGSGWGQRPQQGLAVSGSTFDSAYRLFVDRIAPHVYGNGSTARLGTVLINFAISKPNER